MTATPAARPAAARSRSLFKAASILFLVSFVVGNAVAGALSEGSLPRPDASDADVYNYFASNSPASVGSGLWQLVGAIALAVVMSVLHAASKSRPSTAPTEAGRGVGLLSAAAYAVCGMSSLALGITADDLNSEAVNNMRDINFFSGGAAHVALLGVTMLLLARGLDIGPQRRVLGLIAGGLAALSIASVFLYQANVLLPLGRVACMVWLIALAFAKRRDVPASSAPQAAGAQ